MSNMKSRFIDSLFSFRDVLNFSVLPTLKRGHEALKPSLPIKSKHYPLLVLKALLGYNFVITIPFAHVL